MKYAGCLAIVLIAMSGLCTALPMANEDELVALNSVEQVRTDELPHILKIAPRHSEPVAEDPERPGDFDTIVEELRTAGVHTSEQKPLHTLRYKELARLLALWQMAQGRNYYVANENRAPHAHDGDTNDNDDNHAKNTS
ncbi:GH12655 [Drosophila grimshawi]|uniref:GH12655 n=2 Tax=Drosophila grimshawi TaxID=7222 RepID=B4JKG7_DROGR|nr:GH12655 [Drosophila grimshawi]